MTNSDNKALFKAIMNEHDEVLRHLAKKYIIEDNKEVHLLDQKIQFTKSIMNEADENEVDT